MRFAHDRIDSRPTRWILAATLVASAASACGGGEEPKKSPASATPTVASPAPAATKPVSEKPVPGHVEVPLDGSTFTANVAPLEGPLEYEQPVEKPLVASFPDAKPASTAPSMTLPKDDELFGQPLVIGKRVIPFDEIKREVCLGGIGVAEIEQAKTMIFVREEIERRKAAGATDEELSVGDAELDAFVKEIEEQIQAEYPNGEMSIEDVYAGLATGAPKERLRVARLFEKIMVPDDPAKYPPITIDAILKNSGGDMLLQQVKETYAERQKTDAPKTKSIAERSVDDLLVGQVREHAESIATIVRDPAPGVLYRVNGHDITVEQIWKNIQPLVTPMEVRTAKQWIVNWTLLKEALTAANAWLTDEEADAAYHAHSDPYKDSLFSIERVALLVKQFPSVDRYKDYRRLYESFARMKKPEMTPEALAKQADFRTKKIVGQVTVDCDVLLCSAFDFKTKRWKENGWADAENRMRDVVTLLDEEQRPWEELVERYSDFYQPPTPVSERDQVDPSQMPLKGRFRNYQRNNFLTEIGESEYGLFLTGGSITDFVFFEQEVGTLGAPMRGPVGWYMPRLIRRTKPPARLPMAQESMDTLIADDYVTWNLNRYAQELIQKNEVYGLDFPTK